MLSESTRMCAIFSGTVCLYIRVREAMTTHNIELHLKSSAYAYKNTHDCNYQLYITFKKNSSESYYWPRICTKESKQLHFKVVNALFVFLLALFQLFSP